MIVYCKKCKLVFTAPERICWQDCIRCGGKLTTEIKDWLVTMDIVRLTGTAIGDEK